MKVALGITAAALTLTFLTHKHTPQIKETRKNKHLYYSTGVDTNLYQKQHFTDNASKQYSNEQNPISTQQKIIPIKAVGEFSRVHIFNRSPQLDAVINNIAHQTTASHNATFQRIANPLAVKVQFSPHRNFPRQLAYSFTNFFHKIFKKKPRVKTTPKGPFAWP